MKFLHSYAAFALIILGVVGLVGLQLTGFTVVNILLVIPLVLILTGTVLYVWGQKNESRY